MLRPKSPLSIPCIYVHIKLLIDEPSPLSISAAVFRRDVLDRLIFRPDVPNGAHLARSPVSISKFVLCKLIILLVAAPLFNLLGILLALDVEDIVTFADADFGEVALGFSRNLSVLETESAGENCRTVKIAVKGDVRRVASILVCHEYTFWQENGNQASEPGTTITIATEKNGSIAVTRDAFSSYAQSVHTEGWRNIDFMRVSAFINVHRKQFRTLHGIDLESMEKVIMLCIAPVRI